MAIDLSVPYFIVNDNFVPPKVLQIDRSNVQNIILADQDWKNGVGEFAFLEKDHSSYQFNFDSNKIYLSSDTTGKITAKLLGAPGASLIATKDEKWNIQILSKDGRELSVRIRNKSNHNYLHANNLGTKVSMNPLPKPRGVWRLVPIPTLKEVRDQRTNTGWLVDHLWYYASYFGGAVQLTGLYPYSNAYIDHPNNGIRSAAKAANPGLSP